MQVRQLENLAMMGAPGQSVRLEDQKSTCAGSIPFSEPSGYKVTAIAIVSYDTAAPVKIATSSMAMRHQL